MILMTKTATYSTIYTAILKELAIKEKPKEPYITLPVLYESVSVSRSDIATVQISFPRNWNSKLTDEKC